MEPINPRPRASRKSDAKNAVTISSGAALTLGVALSASQVNAATFPVTNLGDAGAGCLRQAIIDANLGLA